MIAARDPIIGVAVVGVIVDGSSHLLSS